MKGSIHFHTELLVYAPEITVKLCGYCNYLLFMAKRYSAVEGWEREGILQKLLWELAPFLIFVLCSKMFIRSCQTRWRVFFFLVRIQGFFPLKNTLAVEVISGLLSFFLQQTLPFWQSVNVFSTSLEVLKFFELKVNTVQQQ